VGDADGGGPARITAPSDFTMPVAVLHHIVEIGAHQWLAASGDVARRRAAGRVTEFTDEPLRLTDIERLITAVGPLDACGRYTTQNSLPSGSTMIT
jgi:hypothetical protein